ncbi:ornithine cyclodeaminase family protein [Phytoactinopolyspora alkaliphila]|uniref:Ornithine cyclodeaminase family protein n=1 Tax=Phytoactinopolyspora alkaliphila TaxID=1783498 RepID=A0A6N9YMW4_9ACTN|nr:ornithine cyclodeaminase family protein [Phytoactinopolyspora alkaliphila]NED96285.1 ornithine cyclodeaminase family protein [Phytoactinopolyspora alkaliphila]
MSEHRPPHFGPGEVTHRVPMRDAVRSVRRVLGAAQRGSFEQPPRLVLDNGRLLVMVATHRQSKDSMVKTVSVRIGEGQPTAASIEGTLLWISGDRRRGTFTADGASVTALRTGAVTGAATDILAEPAASRLAVLGAGRQAAAQVAAVCTVRPIQHVAIWNRTIERARTFAESLAVTRPDLDITIHSDADEAVRTADVVCCATASTEPLFSTESVRTGTHVNAVGSYRAGMAELPTDLIMSASAVVVDDLHGCMDESGEIISALDAGLDASALIPLGRLDDNARPSGRSGHSVFKSVGCAVLDWAIASLIARDLTATPDDSEVPA